MYEIELKEYILDVENIVIGDFLKRIVDNNFTTGVISYCFYKTDYTKRDVLIFTNRIVEILMNEIKQQIFMFADEDDITDELYTSGKTGFWNTMKANPIPDTVELHVIDEEDFYCIKYFSV